jgi:hypothetical protein
MPPIRTWERERGEFSPDYILHNRHYAQLGIAPTLPRSRGILYCRDAGTPFVSDASRAGLKTPCRATRPVHEQ